jgi:very-short-patch-repair endonuclease
MPETNHPLGRYVPDFMWREQRVIVELDSYTFHGGPNGFDRDHDKDLFYRQGDFDVLRPTRGHVVNEPTRVLVLVAQALARRQA